MNTVNLIRQQIVQPVLTSVELESQTLETFLALFLASPLIDCENRYGPYLLTQKQHWAVWDNHLVHEPERASLVRGFASQRRFLTDPDQELALNWGYAVAIAALHLEFNISDAVTTSSLTELEAHWFQLVTEPHESCQMKGIYFQTKRTLLGQHASGPCAA